MIKSSGLGSVGSVHYILIQYTDFCGFNCSRNKNKDNIVLKMHSRVFEASDIISFQVVKSIKSGIIKMSIVWKSVSCPSKKLSPKTHTEGKKLKGC